MFGKKKKSKLLEKVIMGAVIGGAIGSVVGASIKGKKEEPVKEIIETAHVVGKKSRGLFMRFLRFIMRRKNQPEMKQIPNEMDQTKHV